MSGGGGATGDTRPYRLGVGAVVLNKRGQVFVARRTDTGDEAWQLPQGGIDEGETPRQAVVRELAEETGIEGSEILAETSRWLSYDLPADIAATAWDGRYRGQRQKWFALRFRGRDEDIDLARTTHPEFEAWRWAEFDDLPGLIIPFKRALYEEIVAEFRHLAAAGGGSAMR